MIKLTDEQINACFERVMYGEEPTREAIGRAIEAEVLRLNGGGGEAVAVVQDDNDGGQPYLKRLKHPLPATGTLLYQRNDENGLEVIREDSQEAAHAIQAMLKEYGYPSNPTNAARAGWRACRLSARPQKAAPQPQQAEPGAVMEGKLWLWKNFVNGRPEYWAFDNPYPVRMDCGDPQTLGEPCGYAIFKPSRNGRPDVPEERVLAAILIAQQKQMGQP